MLVSIVVSSPAVDLGQNREAIIILYYCFVIIGGQIGLPLLLATIFFGRDQTHRHPTLINVLLSFVVYATSALLLLYSGQRGGFNPTPPLPICLIQASLIYGGTLLVASSTACLMVQLWMDLKGFRSINARRQLTLLLGTPWVLFLSFQIASVIFGSQNPSLVSIQRVFFCSISSHELTHAVAGITTICLVVILFFGVALSRMLYLSARQVLAVNQSSYHLALRVIALAIYAFITFAMTLTVTVSPTTHVPYMFFATLPLAAFLVLGTQKDILRVWISVLRRYLGVRYLRHGVCGRTVLVDLVDPVDSEDDRSSGIDMDKSLPPTPITEGPKM